jgi:hypothetical protein
VGRVRLSPAGDGAEGAEETCEKQRGTAWWMDGLVGCPGQALFLRGKLKLAERHSSSAKAAREEGASAVRGPCRHLRSTCNASPPTAQEGFLLTLLMLATGRLLIGVQ